MITPKDFIEELKSHDLGDIIEVPCSILKPLLNYLFDSGTPVETPVNEAIAMGIASGSYMSSKKIPIVMMQNSGFCNTLNSLTSLNQVYEIPVLYLITWRGFGGKGKDAPEHDIPGENLESYLDAFRIPYEVISEDDYKEQILRMVGTIRKTSMPAALILKKGIIEPYEAQRQSSALPLSRLEALSIIKNALGEDTLYISSNGLPSRDSFAAKATPDFYMVGSMGHALPIGIGICRNTQRRVAVVDGDGSAIMHIGAMASVKSCKNLIHIVLDNKIYDSTGGQPTLSSNMEYDSISRGFGYNHFVSVSKRQELEKALAEIMEQQGPVLIQVLINNEKSSAGERVSDIHTCPEIKEAFMKRIAGD